MVRVSGCRAAVVAAVRLVFAYGSEKQGWVDDVAATFNAGDTRAGGTRIRVQAVPMGSGELVGEILSGRLQAHVASPASKLALTVANASSRAATGRDLLGPTESLQVGSGRGELRRSTFF